MSETMEVIDDTGRKISLRVIELVDMLDLMEAAGDASTNQGYLRLAMTVCSVTAIDDVPVPMPRNKQQVRDLAKRVGNSGMVAIGKRFFPVEEDAAPNDVADTAKN